jgi:hypothetical protein
LSLLGSSETSSVPADVGIAEREVESRKTARRVPRAASSASILATASALNIGPSAGSSASRRGESMRGPRPPSVGG